MVTESGLSYRLAKPEDRDGPVGSNPTLSAKDSFYLSFLAAGRPNRGGFAVPEYSQEVSGIARTEK